MLAREVEAIARERKWRRAGLKMALCLLVLPMLSCSDKSSEERVLGNPGNEIIVKQVDEESEPYEMPAELREWFDSEGKLDASICSEAPGAALDSFGRCVVAEASERCAGADWCFIDCTNKDIGRFAGGGCWHLCYQRGSIGAPDNGFADCLAEDALTGKDTVPTAAPK